MEECRDHNRKVHVWTVDEEAYMRMVCEQRVDAMITNYPDLGKQIASEYTDGKIQPELVRAIRDKGMAAL